MLALFYPYDFDSRDNHSQWMAPQDGIKITQRGQLVSRHNPTGLYEKLTQGEGLTLELWLKAIDLMQDGPARIMTYSLDPTLRNFTLAQSQDRLIMRLRTERTDVNGVFPHMAVPHVFQASQKIHIALTYDFETQCVFINGERRTCEKIPGGNFSNWDPEFKLVIANEASGDRPWVGEIYFAAIYDRALAGHEISRLFGRRMALPASLNSDDDDTATHPVVRYRFNEKRGDTVIDTGAVGIDLDIPDRLPLSAEMFSLRQLAKLPYTFFSWYTLCHILLFIPFGLFLFRRFRLRYTSILLAALLVWISGVTVSFGLEILQPFLTSRTSSLGDVIANLIGLSIGIMIAHRRWRQDGLALARR